MSLAQRHRPQPDRLGARSRSSLVLIAASVFAVVPETKQALIVRLGKPGPGHQRATARTRSSAGPAPA